MSKNKSIALVVSPRIARRWTDVETPLIEDELHAQGLTTERVSWYEENDWSKYSLIVVRSPWDFYWHQDDFVAWANTMKRFKMLNSAEILLWNLNKHYLEELNKAGVNTVPTHYAKPGTEPRFPHGEFVVKPVISEGAINTARYSSDQLDIARAHVEKLNDEGIEAMIQPYVPDIDITGERSLLFYNEIFSHAIKKGAVLKTGEAYDVERESHPHPVLYEPSEAELTLAKNAIAAVPRNDELLYARVDIATDDNGDPVLMELELLDPVLFIQVSDGAPKRYAEAIASRL